MALWIVLGFVLWVYAFRGYLSSKFILDSDAISYYEHIKFFIENLGSGVYPLWDPMWYNGAPNDFFLRRIGALNPFYLIILIFKWVGIPYTLGYLWFLALYYWGGMVAFYLLAIRLYQDRFMAYAGYLVLMFSALGTRLFDSYMMLVTVPSIWFFYFLIAFSQTPRRNLFCGMVLSFMIVASTYIPFYFLILLGLFLLLFGLVYFDQIPELSRRYAAFFKENALLVLVAAGLVLFSFVPIISFFHDSAKAQVVLPLRHDGSSAGHVLTVSHKTLEWGAVEDLMYSFFFSNLRLYKFAVVYVPFFSVIVILLGLIGRIKRQTMFIFLLGAVLFCCIVPYGLPFYDFFYHHVFFLKYFRNLHFFIWFFLIPLFVLLMLEHWKMFTQIKPANSFQRTLLVLYVLAVHASVFLFIWWRRDAVESTYVMVFLSLVFWSLTALGILRANLPGYLLLTLLVLVQPLQVYHYFSLKASLYQGRYSVYDRSCTLPHINEDLVFKPEDIPFQKEALYYASGGYNFIYQNISNLALAEYLRYKLILVDHLESVDRDASAPVLEHNFLTHANAAIVFNAKSLKFEGNDPNPPAQAQKVDDRFPGFKLLKFNANQVSFILDIPYEKFLVYNDSFDPRWKVSLNHHVVPLYEVNGAFKGAWIPAGHNVVEFSYGTFWQYAMNILLSVFAFIFLLGTLRIE
jgi:hypothetical protein